VTKDHLILNYKIQLHNQYSLQSNFLFTYIITTATMLISWKTF